MRMRLHPLFLSLLLPFAAAPALAAPPSDAEVGDAASAVLDRHRAGHRTTADEARALATLRAAARSACDEVALLLGDPPPAAGQPVGSNR